MPNGTLKKMVVLRNLLLLIYTDNFEDGGGDDEVWNPRRALDEDLDR